MKSLTMIIIINYKEKLSEPMAHAVGVAKTSIMYIIDFARMIVYFPRYI